MKRAQAVVSVVAMLGALASSPGRTAQAQELALAGRAPRFLYAASVGAAPVEIDATRHAALRRVVSLHVDDPTIGRLLAAIERQTGLTFAYDADFPLQRPITLRAESITVAAALSAILLDTGVDVLLSRSGSAALVKARPQDIRVQGGSVVGRVTDAKTQTPLGGATVVILGTSRSVTTGNDGRYRIADVAPGAYTVRARYIGYTPGTASVTVSAGQEATADFTLEKSAQRLDEVVTTGTVVPTEVKALPTPISVVSAEDLERQNVQQVDQVFRGMVPGGIAWDLGPSKYPTEITVRGASTLSTNPSIKTFIDGVEVADPNALAPIDVNSIDRIEVTRGPQASTLYGAGALNGVMQIFTKKGQFGLTQPEVTGKLSAGGVGGFGGASTALTTDNSLSLLGGGERSSYNLGGSYRHTGEWVASHHLTDWGVSAGGQTIQGPFTISSSARYADETYDSPWNPALRSYTAYSQPPNETNRIREQTYGVTAILRATPGWQHTLTLGYDQTYYDLDETRPRFTTPADSFVSTFAQHAAKTSLLYHTDLSLRLGNAATAVTTVGVNHDAYDYLSAFTGGATHLTGNLDGFTFVTRTPWTNTGYFGQVQVNVGDRLFLTGGLRAERNPNFGADFGTAWSPRVGAAYVLGGGSATVKLRASYGESIRAPEPGERDASVSPFAIQLANPALAPERQRGADGGGEVYFGRASLGVTYYNQRAIDLISGIRLTTVPGPLPTSQFQNISRVKNEGWEFEGRLPLGPVQISGTYSITNSTVQQLPASFPAGSYQVGDPIIDVPHTSAGASVTYSPLPQTTLTVTMTYIGHWIDADYVALYGFYFGGQPYRGSQQAYWIEYPTVTKFNVGVNQVLRNGVTAFVRAENVGNNLRYEQQNLLIPTPRTILAGATFRY